MNEKQMMAMQCQRCGGPFQSTWREARYCKECRIEAARKSAKERGLNRMGNEAYSMQRKRMKGQ